jgi:hypothetical protein
MPDFSLAFLEKNPDSLSTVRVCGATVNLRCRCCPLMTVTVCAHARRSGQACAGGWALWGTCDRDDHRVVGSRQGTTLRPPRNLHVFPPPSSTISTGLPIVFRRDILNPDVRKSSITLLTSSSLADLWKKFFNLNVGNKECIPATWNPEANHRPITERSWSKPSAISSVSACILTLRYCVLFAILYPISHIDIGVHLTI